MIKWILNILSKLKGGGGGGGGGGGRRRKYNLLRGLTIAYVHEVVPRCKDFH